MNHPGEQTDEKCPECRKGLLVLTRRTEDFDFDAGDGIVVRAHAQNVPVKQCPKCGEEFFGPEAAHIRHDAVCVAMGYLTPTEYRRIREGLDWSQQELADLTGYGVATVSRAERGRQLPNRNYDKTLRALRDCPPYRDELAKQLVAPTQDQAAETVPGGDVAVSISVAHSEFTFRPRALSRERQAELSGRARSFRPSRPSRLQRV
ncbi:MAG: type II toxin-antitoxin system MqsA family antitoxin [Planctomycetes bacterium]|nr:type II toxin-antitoxin system MqsA family antitoxin [Planctomycetota bacterium]